MGPKLRWNSDGFHLFCFQTATFVIYIYIHKKIFMYRGLIILVIFLVLSNHIQSQERYSEYLYDEISTETYTYATKDGEDLKLDIYLPQADADFERATIVYVHGGGFSSGERDSEKIKQFCNQMAGYGYVVASISYRLTRKGQANGFGCNCPAEDKLNTFLWAVQDVQDATFFLIQNMEQFGINPQKIILAGSSAGAEAVLNAAYLPPMCYGLDSGPVSYAGVIGMAGAIPDTVVIYDESAVPSMFFHGTDDNLVPYASAAHHYCKPDDAGYLMLNGSYTIAERLKQLDVPYWLHTTCGGGHEMADKPMTEYFNEIAEFCYKFVIMGEKESRNTVIEGPQKNLSFRQFDYCGN
jgi:predicted esterase